MKHKLAADCKARLTALKSNTFLMIGLKEADKTPSQSNQSHPLINYRCLVRTCPFEKLISAALPI